MTGLDASLLEQASRVLEAYREGGLRLVTVESCTGGMIAGYLTEIAGSSDVVERGFVTYSNEAKEELVGVPADLIGTRGAVSDEVARVMAEGGLMHSRADVSVAVTGIAGPEGGSADKPIGLVYLAIASHNGSTRSQKFEFGDAGRHEVRRRTVEQALALFLEEIRAQ